MGEFAFVDEVVLDSEGYWKCPNCKKRRSIRIRANMRRFVNWRDTQPQKSESDETRTD